MIFKINLKIPKAILKTLSVAFLNVLSIFYLFLYLYTTRITINKDTPHLQSLKMQSRRAALGKPAMKLHVIFMFGFTSKKTEYINVCMYG